MRFTSRLTALLIVLAAPAAAGPAISPRLHDVRAGGLLHDLVVHDEPGVGQTIDLIVTGSMSDAALEALQASIGTRLPDGTRTIRVPIARLPELAGLAGMRRIAASYRCRKLNDVSVPSTNARPGWWNTAGGGVFTGDAGAGVIVGLVDTGVDWTHDDFKNPDGTTRILWLWDQNDGGGPHPTGFGYGSEWSAANINAGTPREKDTDGHGSHVLGTAAGDGSATGNGQLAYQFTGMAPKADLVVVATTFDVAAVIDGVNYVFQKAAAAGKSAVVNLSLGTQFGAHDGSDTFDTSLDALTGPGRIVCVAAGNEGGQSLHAKQLVPPGAAQTVTFNVPSYTPASSSGNDIVMIDAYYPASANMQVTLTSPGPTPDTVGPVTLGTTGANASSLAGNIYVENGFSPAPGGDRNVYIQIYDSNASRPPRAGTWTITLTPVSTTASTAFEAWLADVELGTAGAAALFSSDVDEHDLVSSPGSATQAITVGAYITKGQWPAIDGFAHAFAGLGTVGALCYFSSPGPLRSGAQKPDIAAPGAAIVSTRSADATYPTAPLINPDGKHYTEVGTSMASPHVAGAVALLLANTPTLTPAQVKAKLAGDALVDGYTGAVPNANWGYGKLWLATLDLIAPTVTVAAPNGGETWSEASQHAITWSASDNVGVTSIKLEYSVNGGASWSLIASGVANVGTYAWTVPAGVSSNAEVRVSASDAAAHVTSDVSNAVFSISGQVDVAPATFAEVTVLPARPNPFRGSTTIGFGLPAATHVHVALYSVDGRLVRTLADREFPAGLHELPWDGRSDAGQPAASGLYFCRFIGGDLKRTIRLALSR